MWKKKKEVKTQLAKFNRIDSNKQPSRYQFEKTKYITNRYEYQNLIREKRKLYNQQAKEQVVKDSKDSKMFWSTIRKLNFRKVKFPNITMDQWQYHYTELLNPNNLGSGEVSEGSNVNDRWPRAVKELDEIISDAEINKALDKLKKGKAPGVDEISAEILVLSREKILPYLNKLFK